MVPFQATQMQSRPFVLTLLPTCLFFLATVATPAHGSDWIEFANETSTRLVADPSVGANDVAEKDYFWGDVDLDGFIDLVCVRKQPFTNGGKRRNVLFMNEGGVLVDRTAEYVTDASDGGQGFLDLTADRDVELVDVDGDGWLDIVTGTTLSQGFPKTISHPRVYINKGSIAGVWQGFFYDEPLFPTLPLAPNFCGLGVGDVTGNGAPDLYFTDYNSTLEDRLLINDGSGGFTDESSARMSNTMLNSGFGTSAAIMDMNGNGVNDIVKGVAGAVGTFNNSGVGFFDLIDVNAGGSAYFFNVGDLNNDGKPDIIISDDGTDIYLLNQGNGANGMADYLSFAFPASTNGFGGNSLVADLDADGWNDVFISDVDVDIPGCDRISDILHNLGGVPGGNVTFVADSGNIPDNMLQGIHDMAIFDIDNDGLLDMVLGRCSGTQVWMNRLVIVNFGYPEGIPEQLIPDTVNSFPVEIETIHGETVPGSVKQHVSIDGGPFVESEMADLGENLYLASLPPIECPAIVQFYFSAMASNGVTHFDPDDAPSDAYMATVAFELSVMLEERFEDATPGWTVENIDLSAGAWERVDPVGTTFGGNFAQPENDAGGGSDTMCYITEQSFGGPADNNDVDGGPTMLISPVLDLQDSDAMISYERWHFTALGIPDRFKTQVTNDGLFWVTVDQTLGTGSSWETHFFRVGAFVEPTANVQVRFSVADANPNDSVTESGIDNFIVVEFACGDSIGPEIVHGHPGMSFAEVGFGGYIDPRRESTNGVDRDTGLDEITVQFSEAVVDLGGTELTADAFTVTETGGAEPPTINDFEIVDEQTVTLTLSRFITASEWTTIIASVEDLAGNPVANLGDLGPGVNEPDRIDVACLPADTDQSGSVQVLDLLRFRQIITGVFQNPEGDDLDYVDINRNGALEPLDLLLYRQLLQGTGGATRVWLGETIVDRP